MAGMAARKESGCVLSNSRDLCTNFGDIGDNFLAFGLGLNRGGFLKI